MFSSLFECAVWEEDWLTHAGYKNLSLTPNLTAWPKTLTLNISSSVEHYTVSYIKEKHEET